MITTIAAGSILYLLVRCPPALEPYIGRLLGHLPARLARPLLITLFKTLFSIGLVHKISSTLSSVALNNWRWTSDRGRWDWPNEIAVVTGGCSGIGEEIVRSLARNGIKVVVLDVQDQPERLKKGKQWPDRASWSGSHFPVLRHVPTDIALYVRCDVTDPESVQSAAASIKKQLGSSPSILVNNAGIGHDFPMFDPPMQRVKKLIDVNLTSHWITCAAFCPDMVANNKGHIVELASMSSFVSVGRFSDYSATKAAIVSFSESEHELASNFDSMLDLHPDRSFLIQ